MKKPLKDFLSAPEKAKAFRKGKSKKLKLSNHINQNFRKFYEYAGISDFQKWPSFMRMQVYRNFFSNMAKVL